MAKKGWETLLQNHLNDRSVLRLNDLTVLAKHVIAAPKTEHHWIGGIFRTAAPCSDNTKAQTMRYFYWSARERFG